MSALSAHGVLARESVESCEKTRRETGLNPRMNSFTEFAREFVIEFEPLTEAGTLDRKFSLISLLA